MNELTEQPKEQDAIAATGENRDITRPYISQLLVPHDSILSGRGGSDLKIYEQLLSDPQVKTVFEQRRKAVTQAPWQVDAASNSPLDEEAAQFIREQIESIGFDNVTDKMLYGIFYGFSVAEILYEVQGNKLGWKKIIVRNRRRFKFDKDSDLRLITPANPTPGEPAPMPYFWHMATGSDNDDEPYGIGLAHWLYWPVFFKRNGMKFWLIFLEKFGMPTAIGKYESGASTDEKRKLLQATKAIQTDSGVIMPTGMTLDLLEASRSGTADYKALHDTMEETIAKVTLGQTMTSQDGSSQSQANVHMEVRQDIIKGDSDLVCESFNLGPVKWLVELNFPGASLPRVYRMLEQEEDLDKAADTDTKISALGFKPGLEYVKDKYGEHWEASITPTAVAAAAVIPPVPASFADGGDPFLNLRKRNADNQDALASASVDLASAWEKFVGPRIAELETLLDETQSLELVRERLIEMAGSEPNADFVLALQKAGFGAQLLARTPAA